MKNRIGRRLAGLIMTAWFLAACSLLGQSDKTPQKAYLLQDLQNRSAAAAVAQSRSCVTLRVSPVVSSSGFRTTGMAYVTEPPRLDYFAYHEWVDTPANMLGKLIETRLDAGGMANAVVTGSTDVRAEVRLDSTLLQLVQEFAGDSSSLVLAVKVLVIDVPSRSLLGSRTFSYVEPAAGANPQAGVEAADRAVGRFLGDLDGFVRQSIAPIACE